MVEANHGSVSTLHIRASASVICGARRVCAIPSWSNLPVGAWHAPMMALVLIVAVLAVVLIVVVAAQRGRRP